MTANIVDEFLVLDRYRIMVLDRDVPSEPSKQYKVNGELFDPVCIHAQTRSNAIPLNYIAVKNTRSFKGSTIEFV